jgi:hypothetical protein
LIDHVVYIVVDHPTIVDLAGDLNTDTRRRRRLLLFAHASLAVVLVEVVVLV